MTDFKKSFCIKKSYHKRFNKKPKIKERKNLSDTHEIKSLNYCDKK